MSNKMQYMRVGSSGLKVSKIIVGCMTYGDESWQPWVLTQEEAFPILKHAYDSGINKFDVADVYSNGRSEEILGVFLKEYNIPRNKVVMMTKVFRFVDPARGAVDAAGQGRNDDVQVNQVGLSRKHIFDAVDASIARLGTYIDVLQTHRLDREVSLEETMKALNDIVESGKARYIGGSSMASWEFQMSQNVAEKHNWHKFISMQGFYNLLYREEEREMNAYCREAKIGLFPWSPLAAGVLAHSWEDRTDEREKSDVFLKLLFRGKHLEADQEIVRRVEELAGKRGVSMAIIAIAWIISKGGMTPVCGLYNKQQVDNSVKALSVQLTEQESEYLEEAYVPKHVMGY
ncbi:uncharacterized protein EAE98_009425 [Botrytis deweyae]|uniref:NADP-dependent oxidoreductase domain-containing protein n=1 Tax=Botrytis deweyae TaxID=2478750 RepID=A0ABQ7IBC7_9HELO|nr:uncharacterized protein EAE98_009425 [Botrytis deweyae]KAF7919105.1 hypothetical protein EAE98_009425 [Botrytis deweyae]